MKKNDTHKIEQKTLGDVVVTADTVETLHATSETGIIRVIGTLDM